MVRDGYGLWLGGYLRRIALSISALLLVGVLGFNFATVSSVQKAEVRPHYVAIPHVEHPDLAQYRQPPDLPNGPSPIDLSSYYVCDPPYATDGVQTCWPTIVEGPGY